MCKCEGRRRATLWTGIGGYSFRKLVGSQKVEEERQKEDYGRSSRAVPTAFPNGNFTAGKSGKSGRIKHTGDELLAVFYAILFMLIKLIWTRKAIHDLQQGI